MKKLLVCLMLISGISVVATSALANENVNIANQSSNTYYLYNGAVGNDNASGIAWYYGCANYQRDENGTSPDPMCEIAPHSTVQAQLGTHDNEIWGYFNFTNANGSATLIAQYFYTDDSGPWGIIQNTAPGNFTTDYTSTIIISS